ncbi:leucine-rich repeat-containing protein 72 isoform X2 [Scleropages formosus]|uniref:Leucine rich repeat containing 72 n=2 Tax=Scleropages formosus TaxID=113540 RepID=A0A8C9THD2_SCLFO|nr:leucine-rich repeat-containing protein 72 isoform X2 [Scleropages formosus]
MLQHLWLNNNKITKFSCPTTKCCLTELYLQNNQITSISGALGHLTNLQVLLLYNNRLRGLEETMAELRKMQRLHMASFFLNPFTQESRYRHYVVHHLPSVLILDKREVKQEERNAAFQMFNPDRSRVLRSVAFGRRAESGLIPGNGGPPVVGSRTTPGTGITHVSITPGKDISHRKKSVVYSKPT